MDIQVVSAFTASMRAAWQSLLQSTGLTPDGDPERTVLIWDDGSLIATGSRQGNILKYLAVAAHRQGEDLTASVLTALRQDAFSAGYSHLFLYTKPKNSLQFSSLFFYPIAQTGDVLLMENKRDGIRQFLNGLPAGDCSKAAGAAVMNCNPFTLGHRYLIETAAKQCDRLYVFVLSEESPPFPAADRLELVRRGTADLPNVTVLPTGPYLISSATFPTYFLKDREAADTVQCGLDIAVFARYYAPRFQITRRFVGTEPLSQLTDRYNRCLIEQLPERGIAVTEVPRLELDGTPVSASAVRALLHTGQGDALKKLVPETTYRYLEEHSYI